MNKLNKIKKLLKENYNLKKFKYTYFPQTKKELQELIKDLVKKYGINVDLNNIDTSNINDFSGVFGKFIGVVYFPQINFKGNVSEWDVSNGYDFNNLFSNCNNFNCDLSGWDVSNGINFSSMFYECHKFNSDLSQWNVFNGKYFNYMFYNCKSFTADLSKWNVKKAEIWRDFFTGSALEKYPKRIPEKFKEDDKSSFLSFL